MYILNPDIINLFELENKLHKILEENEGKIQEYGKWGIRDLVYPIKKKKKGYYGVVIVNTLLKNIFEFIRISHIEQDILRILIINTKKEKGYIQSILFAKTEINNDKMERNYRLKNKKQDYKNNEQYLENKKINLEN